MAKKEIAYKVTVDTSDVDSNIEKTTDNVEDLGKAADRTSKEMKSGFKAAEQGAKGASKGVSGIGQSIGALIKSLGVLGVAMAVFEFLKELLMSNQRVADLFSKSFKTIEIVFGKVAKAVEKLIDGLKELKKLDLKSISEQFKNFGKDLSESGKGAFELAEQMVELEKKVKKADATQRLYALTIQKEIEQQRQIRDNISLTIKERQDANDKIAVLIEQQLRKEKEVANDRLALALVEQEVANNNIESQIKVIEARAELADIEERLTGVLSEQKTNREALRQEETERVESLVQNYEAALSYISSADATGDFQEQLNLLNEERLNAMDEYAEALDGMRQYLKENNEGLTLDQIENHSEMLKVEEAFQRKLTKIVKKESELRRAVQIRAAQEVSSALGAISQLMLSQGEENTAAQKALAISQIAIDTAVAISGAIKTATTNSKDPWSMIAGIAAGVAAVISAVSQATQIINGVNVGGGSATTPSASSISSPAPQFDPVTTNTTELGNTEQAELAPIQAFVVETQLTNTQNNVGQIESQATF